VCDDHDMLVTITRLLVYFSFDAHYIVQINDVLVLRILRVFDGNKSHEVQGFRWSEPTSCRAGKAARLADLALTEQLRVRVRARG
jgi:hypothetical protein